MRGSTAPSCKGSEEYLRTRPSNDIALSAERQTSERSTDVNIKAWSTEEAPSMWTWGNIDSRRVKESFRDRSCLRPNSRRS